MLELLVHEVNFSCYVLMGMEEVVGIMGAFEGLIPNFKQLYYDIQATDSVIAYEGVLTIPADHPENFQYRVSKMTEFPIHMNASHFFLD